jgi:plasmid stabilization system protein ParE
LSRPVRITPLAEADIERAQGDYEAREQGLRNRFVLQVRATLDRIAANPLQYQVVPGTRDARRARVQDLSDAMWRIYSPTKTGLQLKTSVGKFQLIGGVERMHFGMIAYFETIPELFAMTEKRRSSFDDALVKRAAFQHEREVRYVTNGQFLKDRVLTRSRVRRDERVAGDRAWRGAIGGIEQISGDRTPIGGRDLKGDRCTRGNVVRNRAKLQCVWRRREFNRDVQVAADDRRADRIARDDGRRTRLRVCVRELLIPLRQRLAVSHVDHVLERRRVDERN